jgi:poly-beta-hydroxyalkanoate depolymerase
MPCYSARFHNDAPAAHRIGRRDIAAVDGGDVGRTGVAHDPCSKLRPYLKRYRMQAGVGHYEVFSGKRWENQVYPILKNVILSSD